MKIRQSTATRTGILAAASTLAFYGIAEVITHVPALSHVSYYVQRYFCGHPLEYISTAMFFTGMAILVRKSLRLRAERQMFTLAEEATTDGAMAHCIPEDQESTLTSWCQQHGELQETQLHSRMRDVLHYLTASRRTGLEEHLRYLAELAGERLHQTYATLRTITWAIPILGFLGTVIGITMAIANVTPEQLDTSLGDVTRGLSVAFDTTALALGMSIVMVFAAFAVERKEQQILNRTERFGIEVMLSWFGSESDETGLLSDAHSTGVNAHVLQLQSEAWSQQLEELRTTWSHLLQGHADSVRDTLSSEVQQTLKLHREHTEDARDAYTSALEHSTDSIVAQTDSMLTTFEERIGAWQEALLTSSQNSAQQSEALRELGATLLKMTESEERLADLQKLLTDNLHALEVADTMEQTASSLTAAVHILTARTSGRSAA